MIQTKAITAMNTKSNESVIFPENTVSAEPRKFSAAESVFAWICLAIGYLFCRSFPVFVKPFASFLFLIFIYCTTFIILLTNKARFSLISVLSVLSGILISVSVILTSNEVLQFFSYSYCIVNYIFFIYSSYGNQTKKILSDYLVLDILKAAFAAPLLSTSNLGKALLANGKINTKPLLKIIAGIIAAIIPTAAIVLLLSYDNSFSEILNDIFDFDLYELFKHFSSFILGIPIGMYVFGLFISSVDMKCKNLVPKEEFKKTLTKIRFVPHITAVFAVIPVVAVYIIFFVSQWDYYISGFTGVLPNALSYANYAREGFFQLCTVSVINFFIITSVGLFLNRKKQNPSITEIIISCTLSLFTLCLIATAMSKMVLYINMYGLTPKRVYASFFMAVLAVVFVFIIVKQFAKKLPLVILSLITAIIMFSFLCFSNIDTFIAEYNLDRYMSGDLKEYDVQAMSELGDAAIPSLVRLVQYEDKKNGTNIQEALKRNIMSPNYVLKEYTQEYLTLCRTIFRMSSSRNSVFWNTTLPQIRADKALAEIGL